MDATKTPTETLSSGELILVKTNVVFNLWLPAQNIKSGIKSQMIFISHLCTSWMMHVSIFHVLTNSVLFFWLVHYTALKPKVKDHYHAHKLSYWLNLIPKLNQPGPKSPGSFELHLLQDHENPASYEGIVRETRFGSPRVTSGGSGSFAYESSASSSTTGSSSLRSPSQMHFVNGSFVPVFDEESSRQQQQGSELDSSKIVSPLNPSHSGGNKARSSSSASDLFPSESNNNNNINDNDDNNFRSVNSSTRTNSNTASSGIASNFLQAALVVGVLFLLANLYIIMREFRKHQRSDRNKSQSRGNERRKSRDSSPSSTNQVRIFEKFEFLCLQNKMLTDKLWGPLKGFVAVVCFNITSNWVS